MAHNAMLRIPVVLLGSFCLVGATTPILTGTAVDPDLRSVVPLYSTMQAACSGFTHDHATQTVELSAVTRRTAHLIKGGTAVALLERHSSNCGGSTLELYEVRVLKGPFKGQHGYITAPSFLPS
jgi:hypothetical protein